MKYNCALVLEGGGMRCAYTNGILDYFIEEDIDFNYVVSVSAGVASALNFVSKDEGRALALTRDYAGDKRVASVRNMFTKGCFFDLNMIFNVLDKEVPFNYEAFKDSTTQMECGCFNLETGDVDYFNKDYLISDKSNKAIIASNSLPLLSKVVTIGPHHYLDGGMRDSIPLNRAIEQGYEKQVVILTNPSTYVREKESSLPLLKTFYHKYPTLIKAMENRHIVYNDMVERINTLEKEGKIFVLRPSVKLNVTRYSSDAATLNEAYDTGRKDAIALKDKLLAYLKE